MKFASARRTAPCRWMNPWIPAEDPVVREIAVWGEDPENKYSQEELRQNPG